MREVITTLIQFLTFVNMQDNDLHNQYIESCRERIRHLGTYSFAMETTGVVIYDIKGIKVDKQYKTRSTLIIDFSSGKFHRIRDNNNGTSDVQSFNGVEFRGLVGVPNSKLSNVNSTITMGILEGQMELIPFDTEYFPIFYASGSLILDNDDKYFPGNVTWNMSNDKYEILGSKLNPVITNEKSIKKTGLIREYTLNPLKLFVVDSARSISNNDRRLISATDIQYAKVDFVWLPKSWSNRYYAGTVLMRKESCNASITKVKFDDSHFNILPAEDQKVERIAITEQYINNPDGRTSEAYVFVDGKFVNASRSTHYWIYIVCSLVACVFLLLMLRRLIFKQRPFTLTRS